MPSAFAQEVPQPIDPKAVDLTNGILLAVIEKRPAMYLGTHTLTGLWHFVNGFECANLLLKPDWRPTFSKQMNRWVAEQLYPSGAPNFDWARLILKQIPDEAAALRSFFELFHAWQASQGIAIQGGEKPK